MTEPRADAESTGTDRSGADGDGPAPSGYPARLERATRGLLELNVAVLGRMEGKISPSHLRALQSLDHLGGAKVSALAETLGVLPSTASRISDRLSDAGLLTRQVARDNRRATWLETTSVGRAVLAELVDARTTELGRVTARMAPEDRAALLAGAEAFAAAYAEVAGEQAGPASDPPARRGAPSPTAARDDA